MNTAIIVAGGSGTRMGAPTDKLFLEVGGRPLVAYTWERFERCSAIDEIVIVVRSGMNEAYSKLAAKDGFTKPFRFATGGKERQDSVWNGLEAVSPKTEIVVIQDAARPCTPEPLIVETIRAARGTGAAVAARRITDTIKESENGEVVSRTLDRNRLWTVQTPQTFQIEVIRRALAAVRKAGQIVTDDTAACELVGQPVRLVESHEPNPKLTRPEDLPHIEFLLKKRMAASS